MKLREFPLRAAVWSLVLHVLALVAFAPWFATGTDSTLPAGVLHAVLLPLPRIGAISDPALQYPPPSPVVLPSPNKKPLRRMAVEPVRESPQAVPAAAVPPAPTVSELPVLTHPALSGAVGGARAPRVLPRRATPARTSAADEQGLDAAGLRQFRLSLASEARRFRRYPEAAQQAGWSGTVEVRIAVEAGGPGRRADLSRSSGHAPLDAAALEMLQQALMRTVLPESLRGQAFTVLLPVVFEATPDAVPPP